MNTALNTAMNTMMSPETKHWPVMVFYSILDMDGINSFYSF